MEYEFTLKLKLASDITNMDEVIERLGEQGCTDALVGLGQPGYIGLDFVRDAENATSALLSAIDDVKQALPSAALVEVGPDFVGLTDVAEVVGLSRQNIRKLMLGHHQHFPAPIHSGNPSIWHLAQVLAFFKERQYAFPMTVFEVSHTAMQINIAKEQPLLDKRLGAALTRRMRLR